MKNIEFEMIRNIYFCIEMFNKESLLIYYLLEWYVYILLVLSYTCTCLDIIDRVYKN